MNPGCLNKSLHSTMVSFFLFHLFQSDNLAPKPVCVLSLAGSWLGEAEMPSGYLSPPPSFLLYFTVDTHHTLTVLHWSWLLHLIAVICCSLINFLYCSQQAGRNNSLSGLFRWKHPKNMPLTKTSKHISMLWTFNIYVYFHVNPCMINWVTLSKILMSVFAC